MSFCLQSETLHQYRQGEIFDLETLRQIDTHLAGCDHCRAALRDGIPLHAPALTANIADFSPSRACLEEETLHRLVEERLSPVEAELAQAHLETCVRCRDDVVSLRSFRQQMQTYDWSAVHRILAEETFVQRVRRWFYGTETASDWRLALPMAGAAGLAALLVFWTGVRPAQQQVSSLRGEVVKLAQGTGAPNSPSALTTPPTTDRSLAQRTAQLEQENKTLREQVRVARENTTRLQEQMARAASPQDTPRRTARQDSRSEESVPPIDRQTSPRPTKNLVALRDNEERIQVDANGKLSGLTELSPSLRKEVSATLRTQAVRVPVQIARLGESEMRLRGGNATSPAPFALYSPVGTMVESDRPTFRWKPLSQTAKYVVKIVDQANNTVAASSEPLELLTEQREMVWTLPASQPALERGKTYRWYVTMTEPDGKQVSSPGAQNPRALFAVLGFTEAKQLSLLIEDCLGSPLALGILYAQYGLMDEAERALQTVVRNNPNVPAAAHLLHSLRRHR